MAVHLLSLVRLDGEPHPIRFAFTLVQNHLPRQDNCAFFFHILAPLRFFSL